jgi:hypothetical protein
VVVEGAEHRAEMGDTRVELCRTAKDPRDRGNARGRRRDRNICERAAKFTLRNKRKDSMNDAVPAEGEHKMIM